MRRKKIVILPEINNCGGDLSKKWFIYYSFRNPRNDKMKRFKVYAGLHRIKDFDERMEAAVKKKDEYRERLKNGWNPFLDDEQAIYEDQLQYTHVARVYGKMKAANKTFGYYSSKFIEEKKNQGSMEKESLSTYTSSLRVFQLWLEKESLGELDISVVDNGIILAFFNFLINVEKLSGQTIKRYRQLLRAVFEIAKRDKHLLDNPVYNVPDCKRINDKTPRPISEFDIEELKEVIQKVDPQLWLAISFEYYCFLRPGKELRKLKIKNLDFSRGIVDVDQIRSKTNLERFPTIPYIFLKQLRNEYKLQSLPLEYYVFSKNGKPGPVLLGKNNLTSRFRKIRRSLNLPENYKFYSWKHTGNGRASDAGISMKALQDQNGHTSIKTTEIYMAHKIGKVSQEIRDNFPEI